jgi:hypothetical protein
MKDLPQSFSLSRIRPFLDDDLLLAVALGDLTRPGHQHRPVQAVEIRVVEVSLLDVAAHHRLAVPIGCLRTELARAAPGAVAIHELRTTNHPSISHRILPESRMFWTVTPWAATESGRSSGSLSGRQAQVGTVVGRLASTLASPPASWSPTDWNPRLAQSSPRRRILSEGPAGPRCGGFQQASASRWDRGRIEGLVVDLRKAAFSYAVESAGDGGLVVGLHIRGRYGDGVESRWPKSLASAPS